MLEYKKGKFSAVKDAHLCSKNYLFLAVDAAAPKKTREQALEAFSFYRCKACYIKACRGPFWHGPCRLLNHDRGGTIKETSEPYASLESSLHASESRDPDTRFSCARAHPAGVASPETFYTASNVGWIKHPVGRVNILSIYQASYFEKKIMNGDFNENISNS
ncbi:hypothetical protein AVEN_168517-1 [Araneus ventricosus]|uniref:Uncharacterized protein n=1 Tax=Araneus ventricosus TaxID=182803 RepID=A0A4Y2KL92_ARAVE|nr:hypothetical protein AVEN_168517-1 [Araneus ventricosus]